MSKPLDILFVHHLPVMGGATQSLLGLVKHAVMVGYECKVLFLRNEGNAIDRYRLEGIDVITVDHIHTYAHAYGAYNTFISRRPWRVVTNLVKSFRSVNKALELLIQEKPRLVYLNTSVLIPFAIATKKYNTPVIWHLREQIHSGNFGFRKKIVQFLFDKYATRIIAISKVNASVLGLKGIEVIYNSVDFKVFDKDVAVDDFKQKYHISAPNVICFIGGSVISKGADLLVEATLEVLKQKKDIQVIIAGEFNIRMPSQMNKIGRRVVKMMDQNEILKQVLVFTGPLPDVAKLIAASDILIWPATTPHFARPILEAMVMQKPVIASNYASSSEILDQNIQGLLVAPNAKEFSKAILSLIEDKTKQEIMGREGFLKAKGLFDATVNNDKIIRIINEILN